MTFATYILWFCAQFSFDLVTLTFDLWPLTLAMSDELSFIHPTHIPVFSILRSSVPELWVTQSDHITTTWNGHCACAVSRDLSPGCKNGPHFLNSDPNLPIHFVTFGALTKIKPCNRQKIAFSYWKLQSLLRMCSITWRVHRGPPKPHVTIFWPKFSIHYTTFMGLRRRLRVVLYWSIPMLKRFSAARKNQVQLNSVPKMGLNIKYSHRDPRKALPYPERCRVT